MTEIKICGLTCEEDINTVNELKVEYAGFVFVEQSKRRVTPEVSRHLLSGLNRKIKSVALFVDASFEDIEVVLKCADFDYIQLHGYESVQKVEDLRLSLGKPIIKAIGVSNSFDMDMAARYFSVADKLLFDAKPKISTDLPGGNGEPFSWDLLKNSQFPIPWILAGGLDGNNISVALRLLAPDCVDVSSGVEEHAGKKNFRKMSAFVNEVRSINNDS